jgi:hypothetical protein
MHKNAASEIVFSGGKKIRTYALLAKSSEPA